MAGLPEEHSDLVTDYTCQLKIFRNHDYGSNEKTYQEKIFKTLKRNIIQWQSEILNVLTSKVETVKFLEQCLQGSEQTRKGKEHRVNDREMKDISKKKWENFKFSDLKVFYGKF